MKVLRNATQLTGHTPLVALRRLPGLFGASVLAKLEFANPGFSVKDRAALAMVGAAERDGKLCPGGEIIEATSGNTGISLAMVSAVKGYHLTVVMPENVTRERVHLLKSYGANVILTPKKEGMQGALERAVLLKQKHRDAWMPLQFVNPENPLVHTASTGPEIWDDTGGHVHIFLAGVGTGGTVSGVGRYLKGMDRNIRVVAVEPEESPVLSGGRPGTHGIQGMGAGFIPQNFDASVVDEIITVKTSDAQQMTRLLAQREGISAGISSGANVYAAIQVANRPESEGNNLITIICDPGERYLSIL